MDKPVKIELKPCPFCGGEASVNDIDDERDDGYVPEDCLPAKYFEISCKRCRYDFSGKQQKEAVAAWSARTDESAGVREANAIMEECLEKLAKLGNGEYYGNSMGNIMAIEALTKARKREG